MAAAAATTDRFLECKVKLPRDAHPGQVLHIQIPGQGQRTYQVVVPLGAKPGRALKVKVPKGNPQPPPPPPRPPANPVVVVPGRVVVRGDSGGSDTHGGGHGGGYGNPGGLAPQPPVASPVASPVAVAARPAAAATTEFPPLEASSILWQGWFSKQQPHFPHSWQKRYGSLRPRQPRSIYHATSALELVYYSSPGDMALNKRRGALPLGWGVNGGQNDEGRHRPVGQIALDAAPSVEGRLYVTLRTATRAAIKLALGPDLLAAAALYRAYRIHACGDHPACVDRALGFAHPHPHTPRHTHTSTAGEAADNHGGFGGFGGGECGVNASVGGGAVERRAVSLRVFGRLQHLYRQQAPTAAAHGVDRFAAAAALVRSGVTHGAPGDNGLHVPFEAVGRALLHLDRPMLPPHAAAAAAAAYPSPPPHAPLATPLATAASPSPSALASALAELESMGLGRGDAEAAVAAVTQQAPPATRPVAREGSALEAQGGGDGDVVDRAVLWLLNRRMEKAEEEEANSGADGTALAGLPRYELTYGMPGRPLGVSVAPGTGAGLPRSSRNHHKGSAWLPVVTAAAAPEAGRARHLGVSWRDGHLPRPGHLVEAIGVGAPPPPSPPPPSSPSPSLVMKPLVGTPQEMYDTLLAAASAPARPLCLRFVATDRQGPLGDADTEGRENTARARAAAHAASPPPPPPPPPPPSFDFVWEVEVAGAGALPCAWEAYPAAVQGQLERAMARGQAALTLRRDDLAPMMRRMAEEGTPPATGGPEGGPEGGGVCGDGSWTVLVEGLAECDDATGTITPIRRRRVRAPQPQPPPAYGHFACPGPVCPAPLLVAEPASATTADHGALSPPQRWNEESEEEEGLALFAQLLNVTTTTTTTPNRYEATAGAWGGGGGEDGGQEYAECSVCFEDLCAEPVALFFDSTGTTRTCRHFFHTKCVDALPRHCCPLCECPFGTLRELPDPRLAPKQWFAMVDLSGSGSLGKAEVAAALKASLPVNADALDATLDLLWTQWDGDGSGELTLDELFREKGGLLGYLQMAHNHNGANNVNGAPHGAVMADADAAGWPSPQPPQGDTAAAGGGRGDGGRGAALTSSAPPPPPPPPPPPAAAAVTAAAASNPVPDLRTNRGAWFNHFDTSRSGYLDLDELARAVNVSLRAAASTAAACGQVDVQVDAATLGAVLTGSGCQTNARRVHVSEFLATNGVADLLVASLTGL